MANSLEIRERQKYHLMTLLELKRDNADKEVRGLNLAIDRAIVVMEAEDVSYVEKIVGTESR